MQHFSKHLCIVIVLQPCEPVRLVLKTASVTAITYGLVQHDNVGLYFKLWCNFFARSRFAVSRQRFSMPVAINAADTGLVFANCSAPGLTVNALTDFAARQYFAFFEACESYDGFLTFLEIMCYRGIYFRGHADHNTMPWDGLHLPAIAAVCFTTAAREHEVHDMMPDALKNNIIRLAGTRNEWTSCQRGLAYAAEIMFGDAHRHMRTNVAERRNAIAPFYTQAYIDTLDDEEDEAFDRNVFHDCQDPREPNYRGDFTGGCESEFYDKQAWTFRLLDSYFQHTFTGLPHPCGDNWVFRMSLVKHPSEDKPFFYDEMSTISHEDLFYTGALMHLIIRNAAATVLSAASVQGSVLDVWQRDGLQPTMNAIVSGLFHCRNANSLQQAPFFGLVSNMISDMVKFDYRCAGYRREWNNGVRYLFSEHDVHGIYYWMNGYYTPHNTNPLSMDKVLQARPLEWGVCAPRPMANLDNCWSLQFVDGANMFVLDAINGVDFEERMSNRGRFFWGITFERLGINLIMQSFYRDNAASLRFTRRITRHRFQDKRFSWEVGDENDAPIPIIDHELGIIVPFTLLQFNWLRYCHVRWLMTSPNDQRRINNAAGHGSSKSWSAGMSMFAHSNLQPTVDPTAAFFENPFEDTYGLTLDPGTGEAKSQPAGGVEHKKDASDKGVVVNVGGDPVLAVQQVRADINIGSDIKEPTEVTQLTESQVPTEAVKKGVNPAEVLKATAGAKPAVKKKSSEAKPAETKPAEKKKEAKPKKKAVAKPVPSEESG